MSEKVIIWQDRQFATRYWDVNPVTNHKLPVNTIEDLSPYGWLLASLGACTANVLHTYASHHDLPLQEVEIHIAFDREFQNDSENCDKIRTIDESIQADILLIGDLAPEQHAHLLEISRQCPIHKMLELGVDIQVNLLNEMISRKKGIPGSHLSHS